jgi:hypothetical protein
MEDLADDAFAAGQTGCRRRLMFAAGKPPARPLHLTSTMKKSLVLTSFAFLLLFASIASAQRNVTPAADPLMEADAKHNLDVARQAFSPLKKAYKQVILRFEQTYAAYPEFSGMEEFLYMAGMSNYYLLQNKGRQQVDPKSERDMEKYAPDRLKQDAITYLTTLVEKYPDSQYRDKADKTLKKLNSQK